MARLDDGTHARLTNSLAPQMFGKNCLEMYH